MASDAASGVFQTVYEVITSGFGGIAIIAFWNRWIVPSGTVDDLKKDRDEWKALYEKEREAHQATREAFAAASQRGDAGVEAARGALAIVQAMQQMQGERQALPGPEPGG